MKKYLIIEGKRYSLEDVAKALGVTLGRAVGLQVEADGGSLEAIVPAAHTTDVPAISIWFNHADPNSSPLILSHVAQKDNGEGSKEVKSFLYDRADGCVAYLKHDVRTDDEAGWDHLTTKLVASGDPDIDVEVYCEDQYVKWMRPLPH